MIAPTLLVGLGGTGSKIVCRVSKMVTEEQRKRIGFAVFDTDINELREIREENPYIKTIQTSTKLTVGEYLNIDTHARDTWFPVNGILNSKSLTEGAGQVRAISRLALDTAIRAGNMEPLHKAIEELYKLEGDSGCKETSAAGADDSADCRCADGASETEGCNGTGRSRAYVYDYAWSKKAGKQDGQCCYKGRI